MLSKSARLALMFVAASLAVATAHAFPLPPPGGDTLVVTAYYSDANKTQLVGQHWTGCGQPAGSWGVTTPYRAFFFPAC